MSTQSRNMHVTQASSERERLIRHSRAAIANNKSLSEARFAS